MTGTIISSSPQLVQLQNQKKEKIQNTKRKKKERGRKNFTFPIMIWLLCVWVVVISSCCCNVVSSFATAEAPIVISGAGPASLMFTLRYLQLNPNGKVEIFERRKNLPRWKDNDNEFKKRQGEGKEEERFVPGSYGFGIGNRGKYFLKQVPNVYEAIESIAAKRIFAPGQEPTWTVDRSEFCAELIHVLKKQYGIKGEGRLRINFDCTVKSIEGGNENEDDGERTSPLCVVVEDNGTSKIRSVPYSFLIGADGAGSGVRTFLVNGGKIEGRRYKGRWGWKALALPEQPKLNGGAPSKESSAYQSKYENARLLLKYKGRYVFLYYYKYDSKISNPFGVQTPSEFKESFQKNLPDFTEFPSDTIIQGFLDQQPIMPCHMQLDKHYVPELQVMLLGDAAVGMYSVFGQGCAYALQSATNLAEAIAPMNLQAKSEARTEQERVLSELATTHQIEGQAIADMNLIHHSLTKPVVKKLSLPSMSRMMNELFLSADPVPYTSIARRNRFALKVAKLLWRFDRVKAPLTKNT